MKFPTIKLVNVYGLSSPGVELGGSEDWCIWNIIIYCNGFLKCAYSLYYARASHRPKFVGVPFSHFFFFSPSVSQLKEIRVVNLGNSSFGNIYHLNFPLKPVAGLHFVQRFVAPLGYSIQLHFYKVVPSTRKFYIILHLLKFEYGNNYF